VLRNAIRPYDCAARYGGEEFLVVLSGVALDDARECGERIRKRVRAEQIDGGPMTVSIGVAEYPAHGDTEDAIIGQADAALFRAKRAGRDRVVCASTRGRKQEA
jgi:diguanylate cyclase (GGDEF)-like protein